MKKLLLLLVFVAGPGFLNAENLIKNDKSDWENVAVVEKNGVKYFQNEKPMVDNKMLVPVDVNAKYRLSGKLMLGDPAPKTLVFLGLTPYCGNKAPIKIWEVNTIKGTETELSADYKAGSKVMRVKDAANWKVNKYAVVALNADHSGNFSDLPNRNVAKGVLKIEKKDSDWEITLANPYTKDCASGTKIRIHSYGGHHMYSIMRKPAALSASEPKEFSVVISGEARRGGPGNKFWKGTKFVNVFVFALGGAKARVLFSDIKFEKIK